MANNTVCITPVFDADYLSNGTRYISASVALPMALYKYVYDMI